MKRAVLICGIICLLFPSVSICQLSSNAFEYEIDRLLAGANPQYYSDLKNVLSTFEDSLIANDVIQDNSFASFVALLNEIEKDIDFKPDVEYDLENSLKNLGDGLKPVLLSSEAMLIASKYLNVESSKSHKFSRLVSDLIEEDQPIDRSRMASLLLEVYDQEDFKLPLVRLKFFKFLDPNYDLIVYSYIGKPIPD